MPYGTDRVNVQNQSFNPSYKFTDQEKDNESDLYYYDARYFNQSIGRFIQSDPLALKIALNDEVKEQYNKNQDDILGNPQNLNSYAYANNNPIIYSDPDGEFAFIAVALVWAAFTAWDAYDAYKTNSNPNATTGQKAYTDSMLALNFVPLGGVLNKVGKVAKAVDKVADAGKVANRVKELTKFYGKSIAQKMIKAGDTLSKEGLKVTDHALGNIITQESKGLTVDKVVDVFNSGVKYKDTKWGNINIIKDNIRISLDKTGKVINVLAERKINWTRFKELE